MNETDARQRSANFLAAVNCSSTLDTDDLLACLRQLDAFFIRDNEWVTSEFVVTSYYLLFGKVKAYNKNVPFWGHPVIKFTTG